MIIFAIRFYNIISMELATLVVLKVLAEKHVCSVKITHISSWLHTSKKHDNDTYVPRKLKINMIYNYFMYQASTTRADCIKTFILHASQKINEGAFWLLKIRYSVRVQVLKQNLEIIYRVVLQTFI